MTSIKQYEVSNHLTREGESFNLSPNARLSLITLCSYLNLEKYPTGTVKLTTEQISKKCGISISSIKRGIKELQENDFISYKCKRTSILEVNFQKIMDTTRLEKAEVSQVVQQVVPPQVEQIILPKPLMIAQPLDDTWEDEDEDEDEDQIVMPQQSQQPNEEEIELLERYSDRLYEIQPEPTLKQALQKCRYWEAQSKKPKVTVSDDIDEEWGY